MSCGVRVRLTRVAVASRFLNPHVEWTGTILAERISKKGDPEAVSRRVFSSAAPPEHPTHPEVFQPSCGHAFVSVPVQF
jgi:hypothetical protein